MFQVTFQNHVTEIEDYLDIYLKNKSRDCILYSEDGGEFKIHKELFGQTNFLRKILATVNDQCCGIMEVFCPCSKEELRHLVGFLYSGEIQCEKESDLVEIIYNLKKVFDFPYNLGMQGHRNRYNLIERQSGR